MENTKATGLLNDLIEINNDRVAGFEKVLADIKDKNVDLKELFQRYATQSRRYAQELTALAASDGKAETSNSVAGTLHRAWIDVKSLFGGDDRASILSEAERGEDAIKKAYKEALDSAELPANAAAVVSEQASGIKQAHDEIRSLRDAAKK